MEHLDSTGAAQALRNRFANGASILGICLGMQLALEHSDEDGGVDGIGLLRGTRASHDRGPGPSTWLGDR